METNYIYLLQEREFIQSNVSVYKIGRTKQEHNKRLSQYPKGSVLLFRMICSNCIDMEKNIISLFKENYIHRKDIGSEYFEGDHKAMMKQITNIIENEQQPIQTAEIEEEKDDDDEDDEEEEEHIIEVNTFEDYKKYAENFKIIITNKTKKEGFIRFQNGFYRKIYCKNNLDFDENTMETLDDFLKFNEKDSCVSFESLKYNYDSIIKDIMQKCYVKNPSIYEPKYHEYFLQCPATIFDAKEYKFYDINTFENNNNTNVWYTKNYQASDYFNGNETTEIVPKILRSLVIHDECIEKYKRFCYNVIVEPSLETSIFYDYYVNNDKGINNGHNLLTEWLRSTMFRFDIQYLETDYYWSDKSFYKPFIKNKQIRCVIIRPIQQKTVQKMIDEFTKMGIKHFIVINTKEQGTDKNIYSTEKYKKFIKDNEEEMRPYFNDKTDDFHGDVLDKIFYRRELLFSSFVKWCVTV